MNKLKPIWRCVAGVLLFSLSHLSFGQTHTLNGAITLQAGMALSPALQSAKIVRLSPGVGRAQVLQLKDDQIIETPSGRQLSVGSYRRLTQAFESAQTRGVARAAAPFAYSKPSGGITLPVGETAAQLLKRPDSTVVRFANGSAATVAQVKAMKPFIEQRYGVSLDAPPPAPLAGNVLKVSNLDGALSQLKGASDNTILESPQGTRVRVGDLKLALGVPALEAAQKTRAGSTVAPITPSPSGVKP
jgi:hypothetical protein